MDYDLIAVKKYLTALGIAPEIADMYVTLLTYGPLSISELSRRSGVERTRIYRLLDDIKDVQLIDVELKYKRSLFKAAPISNIQIMLSKKEQQLETLKGKFDDISSILHSAAFEPPRTSVQFYEGPEKVKQMLWNQTRSKGDNYSILYENMQHRWVRECNAGDGTFKGIIGDHFIKTQQEWYGERTNERLKKWQSRYVSDDVFKIQQSFIIYGDIVAYLDWDDKEVFGVEIHNRRVADTQRQLFDLLWNQAKPVNDLIGASKG